MGHGGWALPGWASLAGPEGGSGEQCWWLLKCSVQLDETFYLLMFVPRDVMLCVSGLRATHHLVTDTKLLIGAPADINLRFSFLSHIGIKMRSL